MLAGNLRFFAGFTAGFQLRLAGAIGEGGCTRRVIATAPKNPFLALALAQLSPFAARASELLDDQSQAISFYLIDLLAHKTLQIIEESIDRLVALYDVLLLLVP